MAWTSPLTWAVGQLVTAAQMNIHVRDNLQFLYDRGIPGSSKIAETILVADTVSPITLGSIPSTYRHLALELNVRSARATVNESMTLRFNGDSTANYHWVNLSGTTVNTSTSAQMAQTSIPVGSPPGSTATAARAEPIRLFIPDYARTAFHKTVDVDTFLFLDDTAGSASIAKMGGLWRSTAAITSIQFALATGPNFLAGSTFTLYGIG
jgi:hypothetical protein